VLSGSDLSYEKAHKLLLALEAAEREMKDLSGGKEVYNVHV
jgi:hypothetical protein